MKFFLKNSLIVTSLLILFFGLYYLSNLSNDSSSKKKIENSTSTKDSNSGAWENFESLKNTYKNSEIDQDYIQQEKIIEANLEGKIENIELDIENYDIQINQIDNSNFPEIKLIVSVIDKSGNPIVVNPKFFQIIEHNKLITDNQIKSIFRKEDKSTHKDLVHQFPLNIILAIDKSGSMRGSKTIPFEESPIHFASKSAVEFINQASHYDKVTILAFDGDIHYLGQNYEAIPKLEKLMPQGSTALYGALFSSIKRLSSGEEGSKAVILLSDGKNDTKGTINKNLKKISLQEGILLAEQLAIPVFTIAYGNESDDYTLSQIAKLTHASYFKTLQPESIGMLYNKIRTILNSQYVIHYISNSLEEVTDVIFRLGKKQDQRSFKTPEFVLVKHKKLISEISIIEKEKQQIKKDKENINLRFSSLENLEKTIYEKNTKLKEELINFERMKEKLKEDLLHLKNEKEQFEIQKKTISDQEIKNKNDRNIIAKQQQEITSKESSLNQLEKQLERQKEVLNISNKEYEKKEIKLEAEIKKLNELKANYQENYNNYQKNHQEYVLAKKVLDQKSDSISKKEQMIGNTLKNLDVLYKESIKKIKEESQKYGSEENIKNKN